MDASRFPITTPYGQVPGYELNNGWHRGEDRAMPMDTPVLVNGHEIGLSGNSGQVTGPHLHIGRFVGGHDTPPNGGGFHFASAVVTEVGEDPVNGKFVRIQADGASWVYLHLSRQTVPVGQGLVPIVPAPAPAGPPYTITQVDPYKRDVLAGHQKWDLNQPNFDAVNANPILTLNQRTTITVAAELHHHHPTLQQYLYLLEDYNVPQGYNFKDTEDYVPPAPPYVPPAAPVPVKLAPKVELVTEVPYYENSTNAKTAYKPQGTLKPIKDGYFQISTDFGMWNLSSDNMKDLQHWVNPKDNVVKEVAKPLPQPVEVPTPQSSIGIQPWFNRVEWFNEQHMPVPYLTTRDTTIKDYSGTQPEEYPLSIGHELKVYGTIIDNMGIKYYLSKLPNSDVEFLYRYAVPMVDPESGRALLLKKATKPIRNRDHVSVIASELEELGLQFIDFVPRYWKRLETKIIKKG